MATTLFKNGRVIDGSGDPAFNGSVLIDDKTIKAVVREGEVLPGADMVIELNNDVIAPGFIDMHSHADWVLPVEDHTDVLGCLVEQGVTSIVGGNCGISPAPVVTETESDAIQNLERLAAIAIAKPFEYTWNSMSGFLDHVQEANPVVNMAELVGHATIRYSNANTIRGDMTDAEMEKCLAATRLAFDEGACGLSFGLGYDPGMYSSLAEMEKFFSVAAEAGKLVTVHLKALSKLSPCYPLTQLEAHNIRALKEILTIAEKTGAMLQLSHFIFVGRKSWSTSDECLRLVEEARQKGVDVMIDAFPYTCGNTTIYAPFPYWFVEGLPESHHSSLAQIRLKIEMAIGLRAVGFLYKDFQVMDAAVPGWEDLNGLSIADIAVKWKTSPLKAMQKLAEKSGGATLMLFHTYSGEPGNEAPLEKVLSNDLCLFETDVAIKATGYPNPAGLGTFPKILGNYARDKKLFSLENAVRRMTSASAERFGIKDTGALQPGKSADIVVFNPETISDTPPEGAKPAGRPKGIKHVFINGSQALKDGIYISGVKAGRVLR